MISICPRCRGELERLEGRRVVGDDEVVEYTWVCMTCLNWWRSVPAEAAA